MTILSATIKVPIEIEANFPSGGGGSGESEVVFSKSFSGATPGAKVATAIASLAGNGGIVSAKDVMGDWPSVISVPRGVELRLGFGTASVAGIDVAQGARIIGMGTSSHFGKGSNLTAKAGVTRPVVHAVSDAGESEWWHWGSLRDFQVQGNNQCDGVVVERMGEVSSIERLCIQGCASGLRYRGIMAGSQKTDTITVNGCDIAYNFDDVASKHSLYNVKGDGNRIFLKVRPVGNGGGFHLQVNTMGWEAPSDTTSPDIWHDGEASGAVIGITHLQASANGRPTMISATGNNPATIFLYNAMTDGYTNIIVDEAYPFGTRTVSAIGMRTIGMWSHNGTAVKTSFPVVLDSLDIAVNTTNHNWYIRGGLTKYINAVADFSFTGFETLHNNPNFATPGGALCYLLNNTNFNMTLLNEDAGSNAYNRIHTADGQPKVIHAGAVALVIYDYQAARWKVVQ